MLKNYVAAGCLLLLAALAPASDDPARVWSSPPPPSQEALDRLNLQMDWAVHVPMDGRRDGFASIQVSGDQLIVQTRSGLITLLDAANGGRALWRSRPGRQYQASLTPAYNSRCVLAVDSDHVYAVDRATGALQWSHDLKVALSAPPAADERQMYLSTVQRRTIAYRLPAVSTPVGAAPVVSEEEKKAAAEKGEPTYAPAKVSAGDVDASFAWDYQTNERLDNKALLGPDALFLAMPGGNYLGLPKISGVSEGNVDLFTYAGDSPFSAPPGQDATTAYLATQDAHLYAVGLNSGTVQWRYITGMPLRHAPAAVDVSDGGAPAKDLYVTADGKGLARINRITGEPLWNVRGQDYSPGVDRLLAVNPKFVYGADRVGRLLVLDRKNGAALSRYDLRDFAFPVVNTETDRIYLAANDGLIVCLHDKEYVSALAYNRPVAAPEEKPLKERIQELKDKLAKPISEPEAPAPLPLKTYLENLSKKYGVRISISHKAFTELKVPQPDDQMVTPAAADNKPLGDVLKDALDPLGAEYTPFEDTVLISPAPPKKP